MTVRPDASRQAGEQRWNRQGVIEYLADLSGYPI